MSSVVRREGDRLEAAGQLLDGAERQRREQGDAPEQLELALRHERDVVRLDARPER